MPNQSKKFNFLIGADPEFALVASNKKLHAKETFCYLFQEEGECEIEENMGIETEFGNIGFDGADSTGEMRPKPENSPAALAENIKNLIKKVNDKTTLIKMFSFSKTSPIGGHIHLDIPEEIRAEDRYSSETKIKNIHKMMMSFYLPIMLGESKLNINYRKRCSYGGMKDYHIECGGKTYELRTMSGEWLTSRKITEAIIAYLGTIYNEIINNRKNFNKHSSIILKTQAQIDAIESLALTDFEMLSKIMIKEIKKAMKTFEKYEEFKEEIEYIFNYKKVLEDKKKLEFNINKGWGLEEESKKISKRDFLSDKRFKEKANKKDLDKISELIQIKHNGDTNCQEFAINLAKRITAYNYPLKNEYIIIGLRKGIDEYIIFDSEKKYYKKGEIETKLDYNEFARIIQDRIIEKYQTTSQEEEKNEWKHLTKKPRKTSKRVFICIPYTDRINENYKKFFETIYNIEKGVKFKTIETSELRNDENETAQNLGKIYKVFNNITEKGENNLNDEENIPDEIIDENTSDREYNNSVQIEANDISEREMMEDELNRKGTIEVERKVQVQDYHIERRGLEQFFKRNQGLTIVNPNQYTS